MEEDIIVSMIPVEGTANPIEPKSKSKFQNSKQKIKLSGVSG